MTKKVGKQQLSLFESKPVVETVVKASGTVKHVYAKPARPLRHDEVITALCTFTVERVSFPKGDGGLIREQTVELAEMLEFAGIDDLEVRRMQAELRARLRKDVAERYGDIDVAPTDGLGSGALDPDDEVRAARDRIRSGAFAENDERYETGNG